MVKVGFGFDIHKLVKGRKLILGGVRLKYEKGLLGYSDADVVLHALCDALCGALGIGDIGDYFPPQDKRFKDLDSKKIAEFLVKKINQKKMAINNVDITIIADNPPLKPHKEKITKNIANILKSRQVNIKVKSKEKLPILGGKNSIVCFAVAALSKKEKC